MALYALKIFVASLLRTTPLQPAAGGADLHNY